MMQSQRSGPLTTSRSADHALVAPENPDVDPSRGIVTTGTTDGQTVEDYLVPAGATFADDVPGTTPVDENAVKPQVREPLGVRHTHRAKPVAPPAQ
jgi:hypothetical protein